MEMNNDTVTEGDEPMDVERVNNNSSGEKVLQP